MEPEFSDEICEKCGKKMVIKSGRYGKFLACSGFPECKNTKPFINKIGVPCPKEDCQGEVILKKTRKGRIFYGCSHFPNCSFVSWKRPVNKRCPKCHSILVITQNKKKESYLECFNTDCNYKEIIEKNNEKINQ